MHAGEQKGLRRKKERDQRASTHSPLLDVIVLLILDDLPRKHRFDCITMAEREREREKKKNKNERD
jgi:hypothetical protein